METCPIDPVRITVGLHQSLGLLALTSEDEPGVEHDLLVHAGFTTQPDDILYTLPSAPDAAAVSQAVTALRTSALALGIRIGIDPALATALDHERAAPAGPALTTAARTRPVPAATPHPVR